MSIERQCELLGLPRSSYYYEPVPESEENVSLMRLLDEQYTRTPFYGSRRMTAWLQTQGQVVNRKRVSRLLRLMGLEAIYPKPRLSLPGAPEQKYPYLLRGMSIERCNQVWSCDITYIRMPRGFVYLMAVMDWYSRYVLAWEVSVTLDTSFCLDALDRALRVATPEIFNSDQGVQFTSAEFTTRLKASDIRISWDGRGRALDWSEPLLPDTEESQLVHASFRLGRVYRILVLLSSQVARVHAMRLTAAPGCGTDQLRLNSQKTAGFAGQHAGRLIG